MSRNGIEPSCLVFSTLNWMLVSTELMCFRNSLLWIVFCTTKVSSTCLSHRLRSFEDVLITLVSKLSMKRLAAMGLTGDAMTAPFNCFIIFATEKAVGIPYTKLQ